MTREMVRTTVLTAAAALWWAGGVGATTDGIAALVEGNRRYVEGRPQHPNQTAARRAEVATVQKPFAVVVGCSDSRAAPEVIFDQGLGDVFVVRSAGHVVDDVALGSIEFAVAQLGARSIVVLGHERCGAVQAALAGGALPGHLPAVIDAIRPGIAAGEGAAESDVDAAIARHAGATVEKLKTRSAVLRPMIDDGSLRVVGGVYDLDSGRVVLLDGGE